ncbi:hypothetical protein VKT23_008779 [Stygiomarasmius scandens]|uniref:Uncharacterized protein n=1 Tax=Marasmiellus scandens TaxID=2682957 RepID=A0ABR1JIB5_9AGAR
MSSVSNSKLTRIDDASPQILYTGSWFIGGTDREFQHTTHGAKVANATFQFTFNGTRVEIGATLDAHRDDQPDPTSNIFIDGRLVSRYAPVLSSEIQYQQTIFTSDSLVSGEHIVSMTSEIDSNSTIWLDYIDFLPSSQGPVSISESASTSGASVSSSGQAEPITTQVAPTGSVSSPTQVTESGTPVPSASETGSGDTSSAVKGNLPARIIVAMLLVAVVFGSS